MINVRHTGSKEELISQFFLLLIVLKCRFGRQSGKPKITECTLSQKACFHVVVNNSKQNTKKLLLPRHTDAITISLCASGQFYKISSVQ